MKDEIVTVKIERLIVSRLLYDLVLSRYLDNFSLSLANISIIKIIFQ